MRKRLVYIVEDAGKYIEVRSNGVAKIRIGGLTLHLNGFDEIEFLIKHLQEALNAVREKKSEDRI